MQRYIASYTNGNKKNLINRKNTLKHYKITQRLLPYIFIFIFAE